MRKHLLLTHGHKHIHKKHLHHALQHHHTFHIHKGHAMKHKGYGPATAQKKNINSFQPPTSGTGMRKHTGKRLHPLKFKL